MLFRSRPRRDSPARRTRTTVARRGRLRGWQRCDSCRTASGRGRNWAAASRVLCRMGAGGTSASLAARVLGVRRGAVVRWSCHADGRQPWGLRAVGCLALDPDFRQNDGRGVSGGGELGSGPWSLCPVRGSQGVLRCPVPRHPDESQDPGPRTPRRLAPGQDFGRDGGARAVTRRA